MNGNKYSINIVESDLISALVSISINGLETFPKTVSFAVC